MAVRRVARHPVVWLLGMLGSSCLPQRNLDATAQGLGGTDVATTAGDGSRSSAGATFGGAASMGGARLGGGSSLGGTGLVGGAPESDAGGEVAGGTDAVAPGAAGTGPAVSTEPLSELPAGLADAPVTGNLSVSVEASWEVNGAPEPAIQVVTPSATYFLLKKSGMLVSMVDNFDSTGKDWVGYSDSFRPKRGLPNLGGCCQLGAGAQMTTTLDGVSHTAGHVRVFSTSADSGWSLVWDFYRSHVTLTVNRAAQPFSFNYRGVPGGVLDSSDRLVFSNGESHAAIDAVPSTTLPGAVQWLYLADDARSRSMFVLQYAADSLADAYTVTDLDTSVLTLGDARLRAPLRFSLGIVDSSEHAAVKARVDYVSSVTPAN
jgi:hypothetical protein